MKHYGFWTTYFVDANYRGQGIGIQLIDRAKQLVRENNVCGMYLETEKTTAIGNSLSRKMGFEY